MLQTFHEILFSGFNKLNIQPGFVLMPTTRKQKKARKSRGLEMLSDIENLDIMLGENHFGAREKDGRLNSMLPRRSRSFASNESEHEDGNIGRNQRNINSRTNTEWDRNSVTSNFSAEINRLSSELNSLFARNGRDDEFCERPNTKGYK